MLHEVESVSRKALIQTKLPDAQIINVMFLKSCKTLSWEIFMKVEIVLCIF